MVSLPKNPDGHQLEHLVAAHFVSRGCFVETKVTERIPDAVSDIDVVWTDYRKSGALANPVEVKSGAWSHADLFKFFGWTRYLNLPAGQFAYASPAERLDQIEHIAAKMEIDLLHVDHERVDSSFASLGLPEPAAEHLPSLWRYSYAARGCLFESLQQAIVQKVSPQSAIRAKVHLQLVNDALFFELDPRERLGMLLASHFDHRKLAATAACETAGQPVDFDDPPNTATFNAALYGGRHFPVQACLYLSHRARLHVVKAAVDVRLAENAGHIQRTILTSKGEEFDLGVGIPSKRFAEAIDHFAQFEWFALLPVFWQVFLWGWGGFLLTDRLAQEYQQLSRETGIPVDGIEVALTAFDRFFGETWVRQPNSDSRRVVKLMPPAMRGVGALHRLRLYGLTGYAQLPFVDQTSRRMADDHNTFVRLLDSEKKDLAS